MRYKIGRITEVRIAGATEKSFKQIMAELRGMERKIERLQYKEENRPMSTPMTPKEKFAIEAQQHVKFADLPVEEQALRDQMWSKIPAHLRDKANKLAGR